MVQGALKRALDDGMDGKRRGLSLKGEKMDKRGKQEVKIVHRLIKAREKDRESLVGSKEPLGGRGNVVISLSG